MLRLTISRGPSTDVGTFGTATLGLTHWYSLELPWRDNHHDLSCTEPGLFRATWIDAATLGRPDLGMVYHLQGVPGRTGILLHCGNWAGDVHQGLHTDFKGCIGIGEAAGVLQTPDGAMQEGIERSKQAFEELLAITGGADIEVEIAWLPGNEPGSYDAQTVA